MPSSKAFSQSLKHLWRVRERRGEREEEGDRGREDE